MARALGVVSVMSAVGMLLGCSAKQTAPTPPTALSVTCDTTALSTIGQQAQCQARVTLSDGTTRDETVNAQWSSSDPAKVQVSKSGQISALAIGTADVTAAVSNAIGRQTVTVAVVCEFSVSPLTLSFPSGGGSQTVTLTAEPNGCSPAAWTATSNNASLTASPASGSGDAEITLVAAPNTGAAQSWTATIAGRSVVASVAAAPPPRSPPPPAPMRVLRVTLTQGEQLSGPYAGIVSGPSGFTCSLGQTDGETKCPDAAFAPGTTVELLVTLTRGVPGDRPIRFGNGCDQIRQNTCVVTMNADRNVTIAIGCAICSGPDSQPSLDVADRASANRPGHSVPERLMNASPGRRTGYRIR